MEQVTRTVYGSKLQTAMLLGVPHVIDEHSTLNERFGVLADAVLPDNEYPRMQFLAIGNGGHRMVNGADNVSYARPHQHSPGDGGPFKPLPFVLRNVAQDLSPTERARYAMRCVQTYNGQQYFAYYLKRLDMNAIVVRMQKRTVQDGVTTSVDFVPTIQNLLPEPQDLDNTGANGLISNYLTVSALLNMNLTANDCEELLNVSRIMYGDDNLAIISEMQLCAGGNRVIGLNDNSNYREAICAQVVSHVAALHQVKYTSSGIAAIFDVGTAEPLLTTA